MIKKIDTNMIQEIGEAPIRLWSKKELEDLKIQANARMAVLQAQIADLNKKLNLLKE